MVVVVTGEWLGRRGEVGREGKLLEKQFIMSRCNVCSNKTFCNLNQPPWMGVLGDRESDLPSPTQCLCFKKNFISKKKLILSERFITFLLKIFFIP